MKRQLQRGFALPTVLIASVVMLTVLAVSVSSVATVRVTLKEQYYEQLAKAAGEAGIAFAKACLAKNGNVPLWTDEKPLMPSTDCEGNQLLDPKVDVLVVGGGGSGGGSTGGGGGAGGVIEQTGLSVVTQSYPVVVGAGGAMAPSNTRGNSGANSSIFGLTAIGGGGGAYSSSSANAAGYSGGSGGGGQTYRNNNPSSSGTPGQGYAGSATIGPAGTGGGGGAGSEGKYSSSSINTGGAGGDGIVSTISGSLVHYAGGGGGGGQSNGAKTGIGGIGGGGDGANSRLVTESGANGVPNTGGGGGGGWAYADGTGGAGGSGIVIVRYPATGVITATGGNSIYDTNGYRVHRFTTSGTFQVTELGTSSCPTDPRCSLVVEDNLRSSFRVKRPTTDTDGKAITLPNSGYVELLRKSNGAVWRTYTQPSEQSAVVPDLCSGSATSSQGWANAVKSDYQATIPQAPSAISITSALGNVNPGTIHLRKDFNVTDETGSYTLIAKTAETAYAVDLYVDGVLRLSAGQPVKTSSAFTLGAGCHTIEAKLRNTDLEPRLVRFNAALRKENAENPIVVTDTSWRVSTGEVRHFSESGYDTTSSGWGTVYDNGVNSAQWLAGTTDDRFARYIVPSSQRDGSGNTGIGYVYLRDYKDVELTSNTEVRITALCDNNCVIYMDGQPLIDSASYPNLLRTTVTMTPGVHRFGVALYNSAAGPAALAMTVVQTSDGKVLTRTDARWQGAMVIDSSLQQYSSYDKNFVPSPTAIPQPTTAEVLVVGGGGGGGGNCTSCGSGGGGGGGGTILSRINASVGSTSVVVGGGGAGGAGGGARTNGTNGQNSSFGSIVALGGGGGGAQLGVPGNSGGSGGGGSGGSSPAPGAGGAGTAGQGYAGGAGIDATNHPGGGGGGAGGFGLAASTTGGTGAAGMVAYITGTPFIVGAGGGGSIGSTASPGASDSGAGNGVNQSTNAGVGYPGTANTGGGGGGGNGINTGKQGGAGGSGIVVVRYKSGSMVATGGTISSWNGYTIHTFTSSGTFTVISINASAGAGEYDGLSAYTGSGLAYITVGPPVNSSGIPTPFVGSDYDLWACSGDPSCSPLEMIRGNYSGSALLHWLGIAPTGTSTWSALVPNTTVRYQLVAYTGSDQITCSTCKGSNIAMITTPAVLPPD